MVPKTKIEGLAARIDHTILKPDTSNKAVAKLVEEAKEHGFAAVCVPPFFVQQAAEALENTGVLVATVIGFPFGYSPTSAKVEEIKSAIDKGVDELDVVVNIAAIKSKQWSFVTNDINSVVMASHLHGKIALFRRPCPSGFSWSH